MRHVLPAGLGFVDLWVGGVVDEVRLRAVTRPDYAQDPVGASAFAVQAGLRAPVDLPPTTVCSPDLLPALMDQLAHAASFVPPLEVLPGLRGAAAAVAVYDGVFHGSPRDVDELGCSLHYVGRVNYSAP